MAILNSITIGKGKKSLGNVTLQTLGGVTIAKQKIMTNKSNTMQQSRQRREFKRIMAELRKFAPLAKIAKSRVKTSSAFSRLLKPMYVGAASLQTSALPTATPATIIKAALTYGVSCMLADGSKVFGGVSVSSNGRVDLALYSAFPGTKPVEVGDNVEVKIYYCSNAEGAVNVVVFDLPLGDATPQDPDDNALWLQNGILTLRTNDIDAGSYPVIYINGERIGLDAEMYYNAFN